MKVLVADDDVISRTVLENVLRRLGYEPTLTANGREALARIQREEIPLLITDWQMPDIDGLELCRRLRAPGRKVYTYAILLTSRSGKANYLDEESARQAADAMDAGAVTVPFRGQIALRLPLEERRERAAILLEALGERLSGSYLAVKRQDVEDFSAQDEDFEFQEHRFKF